jgi:S1-C subfamily serine protease
MIEFGFYALFILFFILQYASDDTPAPRRPLPQVPGDDAPAVLLPEGAVLPNDISPNVVVRVEKTDQNSVGTAFAVDSEGTYITARHVVEGCRDVSIVHSSGLIEAELVTKVKNRDFAILRVPGISVNPFSLSPRAPARGTDGFMMGFPQGKPADVYATAIGRSTMRSDGRYKARERVIAWVERERRPSFGGSLGGISGGPVFGENGQIIGTVVAGAPRRGRVYTTDPRVFSEAGFPVVEDTTGRRDLDSANFNTEGVRYRHGLRIAQVYCQVR